MKSNGIEELRQLLESDGFDVVSKGETGGIEEGSVIEEVDRILSEEMNVAKVIEELRDTDYKEKDAYFKMVELLKGLAVASEDDDVAVEFLSGLSDSLTDLANKILRSGDGK